MQQPAEEEIATAQTELVAKFSENFTMAENVISKMEDLKKERANVFTAKEQAVVNLAIQVLQTDTKEAIPNALLRQDSASIKDVMVKEWLHESFSSHSHISPFNSWREKHHLYGKRGLRVAARSVLFSIKMQNSMKKLNSVLPYVAPPEEEEGAKQLLEGLDKWDFDIWALREATNGREMEVAGWAIFNYWNLPSKFGIETGVLKCFLKFVQGQYLPNHFHNATHATDVLQTTHYVLATAGFSKHLSDIEILAILFAAAIHDVGHDGFNNNYHKLAITERAVTYNDQSIQENFHLSTTFSSMQANDTINIFKNLTRNQFLEVRGMVITMVLGTDMTKHFQHVSEFKTIAKEKTPITTEHDWGQHTLDVMGYVLHACDISGQCKKEKLAMKWAEELFEEFFQQGDTEKTAHMTVSNLCDREGTDKASSQIGFINVIVLPLWTVMADVFPACAEDGLVNLKKNLAYWEKMKNDNAAAD